jgi:hypothetical protein
MRAVIQPGDIVLVGEITDLSLKVGRITHMRDAYFRTEPIENPQQPGEKLGAYAQFDRTGLPVRKLPSVDHAFELYFKRSDWIGRQAAQKAAMNAYVATWIERCESLS